MPSALRMQPTVETGALRADFDHVRAELQIMIPFSPAVEQEAAAVAARGPRAATRSDRRDLPLVTIDPPGSRDLDQALHIAEHRDGLRVYYAIADVGAFVDRGSAIEAEAWRRGVTAYAPDERAMVYPESLTQGAISLLADGDRPAILFTADLDATGALGAFAVERALVRSRRRLSYAEAQREGMPLLERLGTQRAALARARGASLLDLPSREIVADRRAPCGFRLRWEERLPIEDWNAHVSLLVGMGAARQMVTAGVGLLRVMGDPDAARLAAARRAAPALGVSWPEDARVSDVVASLSGAVPAEAAMLVLLRRAMGRAGYLAFADGAPAARRHAAIAADYAHVTAPLRRLADRYVLDLLCDVAAGTRPSADEVATLARLPPVMAAADARAGRLERELVDATEARTLEHRVGETFAAVVLSSDDRGAQVQITRPPVIASLAGTPAPAAGSTVAVRLVAVDPPSRALRLEAVGATATNPKG
jgi:exoribonuclease R